MPSQLLNRDWLENPKIWGDKSGRNMTQLLYIMYVWNGGERHQNMVIARKFHDIANSSRSLMKTHDLTGLVKQFNKLYKEAVLTEWSQVLGRSSCDGIREYDANDLMVWCESLWPDRNDRTTQPPMVNVFTIKTFTDKLPKKTKKSMKALIDTVYPLATPPLPTKMLVDEAEKRLYNLIYESSVKQQLNHTRIKTRMNSMTPEQQRYVRVAITQRVQKWARVVSALYMKKHTRTALVEYATSTPEGWFDALSFCMEKTMHISELLHRMDHDSAFVELKMIAKRVKV
jgi:hypothetical protein